MTGVLQPPPPPSAAAAATVADGTGPGEHDPVGLRGPRTTLKAPLRPRSPPPSREEGAGEFRTELLPPWLCCRDDRLENRALITSGVRGNKTESSGSPTRGGNSSPTRRWAGAAFLGGLVVTAAYTAIACKRSAADGLWWMR